MKNGQIFTTINVHKHRRSSLAVKTGLFLRSYTYVLSLSAVHCWGSAQTTCFQLTEFLIYLAVDTDYV